MSAAPLLAVEDLTREFRLRGRGTHVAVDRVSFDVLPGETVGLVGESGSGKSTLARCLVGLQPPTSGRILYAGQRLTPRRTPSQRRAIQMVFQDPYSSLTPTMTVGAALREVLEVNRVVPRAASRERAGELLAMVGLDAGALDAHPARLSGGQRQRVAIARALAPGPRLLIADEAVSALDVSVQATVLNLLAELRERLGLTMLFISHSLAVIRHVSDRVIVLREGRIVEQAPAGDVFSSPRSGYTRQLLAAVPRLHPPREALRPDNGNANVSLDRVGDER